MAKNKNNQDKKKAKSKHANGANLELANEVANSKTK